MKFFFFFFFVPSIYAASCCGGADSLPGIITTDDRAAFTFSHSQTEVMADVSKTSQTTFRAQGNNELKKVYSINGSYLINEYWQFGGATSFVKKERETLNGLYEESQGIGDLKFHGAWEFLPELSYSKWKPRGFLFSEVNIPLAPSVHDFKDPMATDSRGQGFYSLAIGSAFIKVIGDFDLLYSPKITYLLSRTFKDPVLGQQKITPTPWTQNTFSGGYSPDFAALRLGISLTHVYKGPKKTDISEGLDEYYWDSALSLSYLDSSKNISYTMSYLDQTLLGKVKNTDLSRGFSVSLQKRIEL